MSDSNNVNIGRQRPTHTRTGSCASVTSEFFVATPEELVKKLGGTIAINRVLIANNGIAAVKCMRSIRQWAYEMFRDERCIRFVCMVTPEDMTANNEYIRMADHCVPVPGGSNNNNYANVDLIVDIARRMSVDAVWAGWGHASENPKLPEALHRHGIVFIGPPERAMWTLGDKVAANIVAQTADIPTLPWSGSGLVAEVSKHTNHVRVSSSVYRRGCVNDEASGLRAARQIGYPVMVKASEGGGGKGIRKVMCDEEFADAYRQVRVEVPGSPIFIMKMAVNARHLEVQLLADQYGVSVSLYGRDCSIQRRHQKIIEEAPCIVANELVFEQMEKAAVRLAKLVGYVSTGTVEYLYDEVEERYYFLELNPRLQVEHPCTELVSGVNLPAAQLQIAMGIPLYRIKCIRVLWGETPWGENIIDFDDYSIRKPPSGHVIAARITSENPDEGFKPSSGNVQELNFRSSKNVWGYFSVAGSGGLHEFADSQFGHCFSKGDNREEARENLVIALKGLTIRAEFQNTVEILVTLLETEVFQMNQFTTAWLDRLILERMQAYRPDVILGVICGSLHVADQTITKSFDNFFYSLDRGQVPPLSSLVSSVGVDFVLEGVKYSVRATQTGANQYVLAMNDSYKEVELHRMRDTSILVSVDGSSYNTYMKEEVDSYRIVIGNQTVVFEKENDLTLLRAPSTGKLLNLLVEDKEHVDANQPYAEMEVMKMVMTMHSTVSGRINYKKRPGAILSQGVIVATLELDNAFQLPKVDIYEGKFGEAKSKLKLVGDQLHQQFQTDKLRLENILNGYCMPDEIFAEYMSASVQRMMNALCNSSLPLLELQDIISSISGRIPFTVEKQIRQLMSQYSQNITSILSQFPSQKIANVIDNYAATLERRQEREDFFVTTQTIVQLLQRYRNGIRGRLKHVIQDLLRRYIQVECKFQTGSYDKCVQYLMEKHKDDIGQVVKIIYSHSQISRKNLLVKALLDNVVGVDPQMSDELAGILEELTALNRAENSKVSLRARQILITGQQPAYELRFNQIESIFLSTIDSFGHGHRPENLRNLIESETSIYDILHDFFYHYKTAVRMSALEVYVRRGYISYDVSYVKHVEMNTSDSDVICVVLFTFFLPCSHPNKQNSRKISASSLSAAFNSSIHSLCGDRVGCMAAFRKFEDFELHFTEFISLIKREIELAENNAIAIDDEPLSSSLGCSVSADTVVVDQDDYEWLILNIVIRVSKEDVNDETFSKRFSDFCVDNIDVFHQCHLRRITFIVSRSHECPRYFTYRSRANFVEDRIYRHLEPSLAFQLEMNRLRAYELEALPTSNYKMHLYLGRAKVPEGHEVTDYRFFVRSIIRHSDLITKEASFEFLQNEGERLLLESLDELEVAFSHKCAHRTDCNHIFMNFVPAVTLDPARVVDSVKPMVLRYGARLWKLRVLTAEIKMTLRLSVLGQSIPLRLCLSTGTGYYLDIAMYKEVTDPSTGQVVFESLDTTRGPLHGLALDTPYMTKDYLQQKRFQAQQMETTYVYDIPRMVEQALDNIWANFKCPDNEITRPKRCLLDCVELILDDESNLVEINRLPGENNIGMVAWKMCLYTPEYPITGREIILIANDITHSIGSFGPSEDMLYFKASKLSREMKIPRLYVSANSGARLGLAEDVKEVFRIEWNDVLDPEKGIKYLYVSPDDFHRLSKSNSVLAELVVNSCGEHQYKINHIIGQSSSGIGVVNLKYAGMIAGETSQAFNEVVTMSMVSCRSIGIGAYLVRLTRRVVQVDTSSIILTGCGALNKLLGSEVYASNSQLGGVQIMHKNGVSHQVCSQDFDGIHCLLSWLSFVPKYKGADLPIIPSNDCIDRDVTFYPTKSPYDPRLLLTGRTNPDNSSSIETGFLDEGSWMEIMSGWANTVVCGRGRLGGIPVGVIVVETRVIELNLPADPANKDSEAKKICQAGQVWFPDSAYKTAEAIELFNREELPLFILANWRGFSGGMKDMYDMIVKFGAMIVDGLRAYRHPITVYIPPLAELRGGAWVVVDGTINPSHMEMYADPDCRGGILEPEGTVQIKFKQKDLLKTIRRLDTQIISMLAELRQPNLDTKTRAKLEKEIGTRESQLLPVYQQVSVTFADMHDTAPSMAERGVIREVVAWRESRRVLYWRLRRRLLYERVSRRLCENAPAYDQSDSRLQRWFVEEKGAQHAYLWNDDRAICEWLQTQLGSDCSALCENLECVRREQAFRDVCERVRDCPEVSLPVVMHVVCQLSMAQRCEVLRALGAVEEAPAGVELTSAESQTSTAE